MVDDAQRKRWAKFRFGLNTQKAQKKDETGTSMAERWLQQKALEGDERAKKALSELLGAGYDARVDTGEFWRSREFKELIRGVDNQVFGSRFGGVPE
ncbi:MAG: hypothetical protein GWN86_17640, partial [Desulfobacterales bacterium]|nr:hypothetical protein [Desulfobacterales bacterium]